VDDEEECCPVCKIDLGCSGADKLRSVCVFMVENSNYFNIRSLYQVIRTCTGHVAFKTDQGCWSDVDLVANELKSMISLFGTKPTIAHFDVLAMRLLKGEKKCRT
jgi:hypothetical protein